MATLLCRALPTRTSGNDDDSRKRFGFEHEWQADNVVFDSLKCYSGVWQRA